MHVGIAIPQLFGPAPADRALIHTFLVRAEALGYDSAWVQDEVLGEAGFLEPLALLGYAAATTRRLRLGSAVLISTLRSPVELAKSLATLDQLTSGRLIVGIGLGGNTRIYPALGLSPEHRVRRFIEGLELMRRLWTEEEVSFEGRFWTLERQRLRPKPVQTPHPPVWFGAHRPAALRRAAELADGWIGAGAASTAEFREQVARLRADLEEAKRDPSAFPVGKRVYVAVGADRARALGRLRKWFRAIYGDGGLADRVAVVGEVAAVIDQLRKVREAGAELLLLNPLFDEMYHLELLAGEILPSVR